MVSTPSRSRQATMISQPIMAGPTSARSVRSGALAVFGVAIFFVFVLIRVFGRRRRLTKNPRPFPAVGFCRNSRSVSTSANGVAIYDDYQRNDLPKFHNHRRGLYSKVVERSSGQAASSGMVMGLGRRAPLG